MLQSTNITTVFTQSTQLAYNVEIKLFQRWFNVLDVESTLKRRNFIIVV